MTNYWRLLTIWQRLKSFQYKDIEDIRNYQLDRFRKLIQHAYERVPMYREFYGSQDFKPSLIRGYDDIEKVPLITKDMIRKFPLEKRVDSHVSGRSVHKETTSGTTGEPLEIWHDRTGSFIQTLKGIRPLREWGYTPFNNTIRLWGGDLETKKSVIQKFGLFRRQDLDILEEPDTAVDAIMRNRCDVLYASRSSLEILAEELNNKGLKVKPRILASISEVLTEKHRQMFRNSFGCNTLNIYGCIEIGVIAWECPHNSDNLHIDMETVLVNFRDVKTTPYGKVGSIIVTNLENYVMPFIRYDLGDLILLPDNDQCSCGRTLPVLGKVYGRNEDVLEYKGRKYYWHFFSNHLQNYLYINKYQIVQTKDGNIEFRIHLVNDTEESRKTCLSGLSLAFSEHFSPLNVRFVERFSISPTEKFKVIEKES